VVYVNRVINIISMIINLSRSGKNVRVQPAIRPTRCKPLKRLVNGMMVVAIDPKLKSLYGKSLVFVGYGKTKKDLKFDSGDDLVSIKRTQVQLIG
jgi:hypothetical protein